MSMWSKLGLTAGGYYNSVRHVCVKSQIVGGQNVYVNEGGQNNRFHCTYHRSLHSYLDGNNHFEGVSQEFDFSEPFVTKLVVT